MSSYRTTGDPGANRNLFFAALAGLQGIRLDKPEPASKSHLGRRGCQRDTHRAAQARRRHTRRALAQASRQAQRRRHA